MPPSLAGVVTRRRITLVGLLALVPALTNLVGALHPAVPEQLLMGAAAMLAVAASSRSHQLATQRSRSEQRQRALADWPPRAARECNPLRLGIFPGRGQTLPPYVPRRIDGELDAALAREGIVVVFGPPGAGKSRAAWEAVRRVRPDAKLVAPTGPGSLRDLLDADDASESLPEHSILWLEQLDQYLEVLSPPAVDRLTLGGRGVLATVEEQAWRRALAGSGPRGTAARVLMSQARGLRLSGRFGVRDAGLAAPRLWGRRVDRCFALPWEGGHVPSRAPQAQPAAAPRKLSLLRDRWLLVQIAGVLAAVGATAYLLADQGVSLRPPAPFAEQLSRVWHADAAGRLVQPLGAIAMREGAKVYPVVYHDPRGGRSDELALYERSANGPAASLRFEPSPADGTPWRLKVLGRMTLEGDGSRQLLAAWAPAAPGAHDGEVPVVVFFDPSQNAYRISALLRRRPLAATLTVSRRQRRRYDRRRVLAGQAGLAVAGYSVGAAAVAPVGGQERLLAGFYRRSPSPAGHAAAWVESWVLGASAGSPDASLRCRAPAHRSAIAALVAGDAAARELVAAARALPAGCG